MNKKPAEKRLHMRGLAVGLMFGIGIGLIVSGLPFWVSLAILAVPIGLYIFNLAPEDFAKDGN